MTYEESDISKLDRLNDPERLKTLPPDVMWKALGNPSPRIIVDIGAGTALFGCEFAERAQDAVVYAIDTEPTTVNWMVEHRPPSICRRLYPILGQETAVPVATGEADLAIMINVHHELADPSATYAEAFRILRGGGQILAVDWAPGDDDEGGPPQDERVSAEIIVEALRDAGFESIVSHPGLSRHSLLTAVKP